MRNELYDSGSRDQYPVDDNQDGRFSDENDNAELDAVQRVTPGGAEPAGSAGTARARDDGELEDDYTMDIGNIERGLLDSVGTFQQAQSRVEPAQIQDAATSHVQDVDEGTFQRSVQQGIQRIPDHQVAGLADALLGALKNAGISAPQASQAAGVEATSPQQMSQGDLGSLLQYAQKLAPGAIGEALAAEPQLAAALGNPLVSGILGKLTKMV